jgi:hypothetical protein
LLKVRPIILLFDGRNHTNAPCAAQSGAPKQKPVLSVSSSGFHIGASAIPMGTFAAMRRFPYLTRPHSGHLHIPICGPLE